MGVVCILGSIAVVVRWLSTRVDSLGRVAPFPWLGVGLLLVLAGAALAPSVLRARLEARLSDASSELIHADVEVHCQSFGQAFVDAGAEYGYVRFGPDGVPEASTLIKREQCRDLSDYLRSDKQDPSLEHVVAIHTLTHEAIHMSGVTNEAETECIALQRDAEMARLLGAPADAARRVATMYWVSFYPRMPEAYRSEGCRAGGPLDLRRPDPPWFPGG